MYPRIHPRHAGNAEKHARLAGFVDKPIGVISASPSDTGGARAHAALTYTLSVLTAKLPEKASLLVPFVRTKLTADGQVTDTGLLQELRNVVAALADAVKEG